MTTICLLLSIVATKNWFLHHLDIQTAFLHGDLDEEVYLKIPSGFKVLSKNLVCKLKRFIYGLKQANMQWNYKLTTTLTSLDFLQSESGYSLFTKKTGVSFTVVLVYVDGLVIAGNNMNEINNL